MKKYLLLVLKIICGVLILLWLTNNFITSTNRKKQRSVSQQYLLEQTCVKDCIEASKGNETEDIKKEFNFNHEDFENYCKCACKNPSENKQLKQEIVTYCSDKYLNFGRVTDEFDKCVRLASSKYNENIFYNELGKQFNVSAAQVKTVMYPADYKLFVSCICKQNSPDFCGKITLGQALLDATFEQCIKTNKEQIKLSLEQIKSNTLRQEMILALPTEEDVRNYCKCFIDNQKKVKKMNVSLIEKADKLKLVEQECNSLYF